MNEDLKYQEYLSNGGTLPYGEYISAASLLSNIDSPDEDLKKKDQTTENGNPTLTNGTEQLQTELPILPNPIPESEFLVPIGSEQDLISPSLDSTAQTPSTDLPLTNVVSSGLENSNPPQSLVSGIESELRGNNADFPMWRKAFDVIDANKANSENKAISLGDFQSTQNPFIRDINSTFQIGGMNLPMQETALDSKSEVNPTVAFKDFNTTSEFKRYKNGNDAVINGGKQTNPYYGLKQLQGEFSISIGAGTPNEKTKTLGSDVDGVFEDSTGKMVVDINGNLYNFDDYMNPEKDFVESENNQLFNVNGVILTKNQKESDEGKPNVIDDLYEFKPIELNTKTFNINNGDPSIVEKQNADLLQLEKEGKIKVYKNEKTDENGNLSWEITNPNFLNEYNDYNAKLYTPSDIDKGYNYAIQRNKILDPILQGAKFETESEDRFKEKFGVNAFNKYGVIPDSEMEQINDSLQKEQLLSQGYSEDQAIQFINQEKINSRQQEVKKGYDFIDNIVKPQLEIRASAMPDATSAAQRSEVEVDEHYQALRQLALNLPEKFNEFAESHKDWDFKKPEMVSAFKNAFIEYVKEDKAYQYAFNDHKIQQANLDVKKGAVNKDVIKVKESREKVNKYSAQLEEQSQYFSQVSELKNEIDSNYFKSESEKTRKDREENRGYRENEAGAIATTTLKRIGDIPFRIAGDWLTTGAALFGASNSTIKDLEIESKPFVGTRQQGITDDVVEYTDDKGNKYEAVNGTDLFYIDKNGQRGIATNDSDINSFISGNKLKETNRYKDFNGANFLAEVSKVTADMAVGGGIGKGVGKGVIRTLTKLKAGLSETNYARKGLDMLIASAANPNTTTSYAMAIQYYGGSYKNYQEKGYTNGEARALAIFSTAALANVNRIFPDIKLFQESDQIALNTYRLLASGETSATKKFLVGKFSEASKRIGGNVIGEVPEETIYEPIAESIVQYMGASISGDRKKLKNIDSPIDFSADTVGLTIGTVLLSGAFGTGKGNINFNQSTPLEKSIFLSKNPEYVETLHNLKNDAIVGESAKKELSAYYTIEKYVDKIPSDNNLNISQTADVVTKLQKIDALKKEIDKSDIEAFKTDIQGKIDVLNADISTILEQSKTQQTPNNESPNAETAQPTPQSEAVQEQTTETQQPQVATQSEQPTITGEQNVSAELNLIQNGQTTVEIESTESEVEEVGQGSQTEGNNATNQLPEMGQGIAQSENATQEITPEEEINEDEIVLSDDIFDLINSVEDDTQTTNNITVDGNLESSVSVIQQDEQGGQENTQTVSETVDIGRSQGNVEVKPTITEQRDALLKTYQDQVQTFLDEKGITRQEYESLPINERKIYDDEFLSSDRNKNWEQSEESKQLKDLNHKISQAKIWSNGVAQGQIENGRITASEAKARIEEYGIPVPKDILEKAEKETQSEKNKNNDTTNPATSQETQPQSSEEQTNVTTPDGKQFYKKEDGNWYGTTAKGTESKVTRKNRITELDNLNKEKNVTLTKEKNGFTYKKYKDGSEEIVSSKGKIITSKIERRRNGKLRIENNPQFTTQRAKIFGEMTDNQIKIEERKRTNEALRNFIPTSERDLALLYFANGGKVSSASVNSEIVGNSESLEARGKKRRSIEDYKWVWLGKNANLTFSEVSEKLVGDEIQEFDEHTLRSELIEVARSYGSSTEIAEEIVDLYNKSTDPYYGFTDEDAIAMQEAEASKAKMDFYNSVGDVYGLTDEELLDYYKQQYENSINNLTDEQQNELYTADTRTDSAQQSDKNAGNGNRVSEKQGEKATTTSPEYQQLLKDRTAQEARVKSAKEKLDKVNKTTNTDFQADQENIFGERPQAEGMFDERADGNAGRKVIEDAKSNYDTERNELTRINKAIRDFENGNTIGTGAIDFSITDYKNIAKDFVSNLFNKVKNGFSDNKPYRIGVLTKEGQIYLKQISNIPFDFEYTELLLNTSDLKHIYKRHFGSNEQSDNLRALTDDDIKSLIDVVSSPDEVNYLGADKGGVRKFEFIKQSANGEYNVIQVYAEKGKKLTVKTFFNKRKKDYPKRGNAESQTTVRPERSTDLPSSETNIPKLFDFATKDVIDFQKSNQQFTPIPQSTYDKLVKRLLGVFKKFGGKVITTKAEVDAKLKEFGVGEDIKTANGEIYGAKFPDGTIYLNPEKVNANTPIHEFSHLWQQLMPLRFKKGVELLKNTPIGKNTFAELKANEGYANKSDEELWNEAMVTVMGNEGERIFNSSRTSKLKEWLTDLFKALGNAFGIRDLSPNDKLSTFVKGALSEVMGTKEIIPESSVEQKEVPIYIRKMSNTDLRTMLDKLGLVMDAVCP